MTNIEWILSLATTTLSLVVACITFGVKLKKSIVNLKKNKDSTELLDIVAQLMEIAEGFTNYTGEEKKEFVMTKLNQFAIDNGIVFNVESISQKIEELILLSKQVNKR